MIPALYARDTPSCWARQHHPLGASAVIAVFRFRPDARTVKCNDPIEMKIQGANCQAGTNGNSSQAIRPNAESL